MQRRSFLVPVSRLCDVVAEATSMPQYFFRGFAASIIKAAQHIHVIRRATAKARHIDYRRLSFLSAHLFKMLAYDTSPNFGQSGLL